MKRIFTATTIGAMATLISLSAAAKGPTNWELRGTAKADQERLYNIAKRLGCDSQYFSNEAKCWQLYAEAGWDPRVFMSESTISFKKTYIYLRECERENKLNHCVWDDKDMVYNVGEPKALDIFDKAPL